MIRRLLLSVILGVTYVFNFLTASAQDADTAKYECLYLLKVYTDTTQREVAATDMMVLRFNDKRSIFYSEATRRVDSIILSRDPAEVLAEFVSGGAAKYGRRGVRYSILKDFDTGQLQYEHKLDKYYLYEEAIPEFNWEIKDETKTIWDYPCQKAVCDFRGRRYEAWFTSEIPIKDGPWKFCGLPGLILSVADTAGHYSFSCIGIRPSDSKIDLIERPYTKLSRKEFAKLYRYYSKDPMAIVAKITKLSPEDEQRRREQKKHIKFEPMERDF